MAGVAKQIIGSFEDIGKDIVRETAALPVEMLGMGKKPKTQAPTNPVAAPKEPEKKLPPREWLTELAGKNKKQREPTVQERLEREKQENNEKEAKQAAVAQKLAPLAKMSSKRRRGDLRGQQNSSLDVSKNARQD